MKIKILKGFFKIILVSGFGIFLFVFFLMLRNTIDPRTPLYSTPKDYGLNFQSVEFKTEDGLKLKGWLIVDNDEKPTIIICHGFGTNRSDVLVLADFIYKAGYNIFLFDLRAHGESQGWYTSFGLLEQKDLKAALEFLKQDQNIKTKIFGVMGVSMGASIAILTAAQNNDIKAVVADSPYLDLDTSIIRHTKFLLKIPFTPLDSKHLTGFSFLGKLAIFSYRIRFFADSSKVSPLKEISRISPRAVLIISGTHDERMPPQDTEKLYLACRQPKELFLTNSSGHTNSYWQNPKEYQKRVISFFNQYLPLR